MAYDFLQDIGGLLSVKLKNGTEFLPLRDIISVSEWDSAPDSLDTTTINSPIKTSQVGRSGNGGLLTFGLNVSDAPDSTYSLLGSLHTSGEVCTFKFEYGGSTIMRTWTSNVILQDGELSLSKIVTATLHLGTTGMTKTGVPTPVIK